MSGDPLNRIRVTADALALRRKGAQIPELAVRGGPLMAAGTTLTIRPVDAWPGVLTADSER